MEGRFVVVPGLAERRCPMAFKVSCVDAGSDCPGSFTTATEDELMEIVHLHQGIAHPDMQQNEETDKFVKTLVKTV